MSITRKFATVIVGTTTGMTLALLPAAGTADSPEHSTKTETVRIANSPGGNQITADFPWN